MLEVNDHQFKVKCESQSISLAAYKEIPVTCSSRAEKKWPDPELNYKENSREV